MVFSFFKRRGDFENRIKSLKNSLVLSFENIKKDMDHVHGKITNVHSLHHSKLLEHETRLINMEQKLDMLINLLNTKEQIKTPTEMKLTSEEMEKIKEVVNTLTDTQKKSFILLFQLQTQLNNKDISFKSIAKILYPEKKYNSVRSTISEYFTILYELGLVNKKRRGKESTVSVSKLGHKVIKKIIKPQKIKQKNVRPKRKNS